jgi:hypothetical protein
LQTILFGLRVESGEREQLAQSVARRVIIIDDQDIALRHTTDQLSCQGVRNKDVRCSQAT